MSATISHAPAPYLPFAGYSWASLPLTSEDIKANVDDLKVLGKGDFKALLKWRTALREEVCFRAPSVFLSKFMPL